MIRKGRGKEHGRAWRIATVGRRMQVDHNLSYLASTAGLGQYELGFAHWSIRSYSGFWAAAAGLRPSAIDVALRRRHRVVPENLH